jgi:predicted oxidoreductase
MAWSPLAGGKLGHGAKKILSSQKPYQTRKVNATLDKIAKAHRASRTAIALAWLLQHPSGIIPIVGSTNPEHIREAARATEVALSREEWYRLLEAARGERLP